MQRRRIIHWLPSHINQEWLRKCWHPCVIGCTRQYQQIPANVSGSNVREAPEQREVFGVGHSEASYYQVIPRLAAKAGIRSRAGIWNTAQEGPNTVVLFLWEYMVLIYGFW